MTALWCPLPSLLDKPPRVYLDLFLDCPWPLPEVGEYPSRGMHGSSTAVSEWGVGIADPSCDVRFWHFSWVLLCVSEALLLGAKHI